MRQPLMFAWVLIAASSTPLFAQAARQLDAIRVSRPVRIDGRIDEAEWRDARWSGGFRQREPREGESATQSTNIAIVYDDEALYVAARMASTVAHAVRARTTRRDVESDSDQIVVSVDSYGDRRTAYSFGVTAAGVRVDYYHSSDDRSQRDYSFDPVWQAAAIADSDGWSAELRIPFSQLRYEAGQRGWGLNVARYAPAVNEESYWVLVPKDETGWASRFGAIAGLTPPHGVRGVELMPYVAANAVNAAATHPRNPFGDGGEVGYRAGLDLRLRAGSNVIVDGTVNPDFGQVEADPAEVNLTVFETQLTDKRPFFTEGRQLLAGGGAQYFYSRRIGAPPRIGMPGDFVDQPLTSRILGAAKLTARTPGGLSLGALAAVTDRERARGFDTTTATMSRDVVHPRTLYAISRLQQQFGASGSTGGGVMTAVARDMDGVDALSLAYPRFAITGATDWQLRFRGGEYVASFDAGFSEVRGASGAIGRLQRSSARYYQRPDAGHVSVDTTRESLSGYRAGAALGRNAGRHWLWRGSASVVSPGFELNDAGRLTQADVISAAGNVRYRENQPGRLLRNYSINVQLFSSWNYERIRLGGEVPSIFADATLPNFWVVSGHYHRAPRATSTTLTRGGPVAAVPADQHFNVGLTSNPAQTLAWSVSGTAYTDEIGRRQAELSASAAFRPQGRLQLAIDPSWLRIRGQRQYVTEKAGGSAVTFGRRYVFAAVDRDELAVELRVSFSMTPDLSLEMYAEPFVSAGRYRGLGELSRPSSLDLRTYGTDGTTISLDEGEYHITDGEHAFTIPNPDFTVQSLRSNVVLRWEWRPGSTLYAVWQQDRSARDDVARRRIGRELYETWRVPGDHRFAIKAAYWLSR